MWMSQGLPLILAVFYHCIVFSLCCQVQNENKGLARVALGVELVVHLCLDYFSILSV
jgi:hypothetical protein